MALVPLWCAGEVVAADAAVVSQARPRVHVDAFTVEGRGAPALTVLRRAGVRGTTVDAPLGRAVVNLAGPVMEVDVPDGQFPAELVLRLAYYVVTARLGGVLVHSSAVAGRGGAAVACGKSGDGKSTLARLATDAGCTLLTDEVVQLFPDGRVGASPFRSDLERPGAPALSPGRLFLTLVKSDHEALQPLRPAEAARVALSQAFEVDAFALPRPEVSRRVLSFLGAVELRALHFRNHPHAGAFLGRALDAPGR